MLRILILFFITLGFILNISCSSKTEVAWQNADTLYQGDYEYDQKEWNDLSGCSDDTCYQEKGNAPNGVTAKEEVGKTEGSLTLSVVTDNGLVGAEETVQLDEGKSQTFAVDTSVDE